MTVKKTSSKSRVGLFLYAIIPVSAPETYDFTGIGGAPLYSIAVGEVAFLVSDFADKTIRPERRHLSLFHEVHKKLFELTFFLPMRFGILTDNVAQLKKILTQHQEDFKNQLQNFSSAVEMGVKLQWDVPNVFDYLLTLHPEIKEARDEMLSRSDASFNDKIKIGQLFGETLDAERRQQSDKMQAILSHATLEFIENPCRKEHEVMNLTCLVEKAQLKAFEDAIAEAGIQFNDDFLISYSGPWVPYSFVKINVTEIN